MNQIMPRGGQLDPTPVAAGWTRKPVLVKAGQATSTNAAVFNLVKNMVSRLPRSGDRLVPKRLRGNDPDGNDPASATIALAVSWASNGCMPAPTLKVRFYSSIG